MHDHSGTKIARRSFLAGSMGAGAMALFSAPISAKPSEGASGEDSDGPSYRVQTEVAHQGWDGITCWVHSRAGAVPGAGQDGQPAVVITMHKQHIVGSDIYYAINDMRTDDLGKTWSFPIKHSELARRKEPEGVEVAVCDFQPKWHAATGTLLGTGHTARYKNDRLLPTPRPRETAYSVYDPDRRSWSPWEMLEMPDEEKFRYAGAGSIQRVDLPDGNILLPIYYRRPEATRRLMAVTVCKCSFDGRTLKYLEHGGELHLDVPRGFAEPALAYYKDRYYLTLRNDKAGYVTTGEDGLHFEQPRQWQFDDGEPLGNYNTQQKWVVHSDGLFLVYTRRGANNDHVFRHRAPLFIARVDPDRLHVIRGSERVLVPERGARLGNFGVVDVNEQETWVTVAEWMQPRDCSKYGSNNSVFVARICWDQPNSRVRKF